MKVFLSWSGDLSHRIACEFREWLPCVLQYVKPYVSSQDIDKGARWSTDIAKELHESAYGILCITRENIEAPWINFEAGALSKTLDKSYVSPFLFDVKRSEVQGPLLQFQSTICEKEDVRKLVLSINGHATEPEKLAVNALDKAFDVWWPQFESGLKKLQEIAPEPSKKKTSASRQETVLEEVLELVRNQQRILRSPETLLPPAYLDYALSRPRRAPHADPDLAADLHKQIIELRSVVSDLPDREAADKLARQLERVHSKFHEVLDVDYSRPKGRSRPAMSPDKKPASE